MEDSWFWESEKSPSSVSSKDNDTPPNVPFDGSTNLTTISLATESSAIEHDDIGSDNRRIVENLRRSLDEKDAEIQQLINENLSLNDKIKQLHRESIEQDQQIEQLDQQHNEAMQGMISIKSELQTKVATLENDLKSLKTGRVEVDLKFDRMVKDHNELLAANEELMKKFDEIEQKNKQSADDTERLTTEVNKLNAQLTAKTTEIADLNAMLEEKEAHSRDGSDKFEMIDLEKDKLSNSSELNRLQTELDEINERLSILNVIKDQYDSNVLKLGSVVEEKNKLEEQVLKLITDNDNLLEEVRVARESVEKLEELQKNLDEINSEKSQNEITFVALQEDEVILQRELDELKADKEKLATELESTKSTQDEQIIALENKCVDLEAKLNRLNLDHANLGMEYEDSQKRVKELEVKHATLKSQAVDLESRLVEENMMTQKQVIDLQSALNSKKAQSSKNDVESITFDELKAIITKYLKYSSSPSNKSLKLYLEAFLRSVKDRYHHLEEIEENRDDLMKQFEAVSNEMMTLQHERKTLKADLHHYEAEVAELMKNNGILLNELENMKSGKLETISEQNEEKIIRLETQIEDCTELNSSLQEEYDNTIRKLEENEEEKLELQEKVTELKQQVENQAKTIHQLRSQVETVELERTNVQLQLDQMRTDDSKLELQQCFEEKFRSQNDEIVELTRQLENLNADHAALVRRIEPLQDEKQKLVAEMEKLQQLKFEDDENLVKLQQENDLLKDQSQQNTKIEKSSVYDEQVKELNETVNKLKRKISENNEEKSRLVTELQQTIDTLTKDKHELIAAIQLKHNENVQYHGKIQELNQMLATLQQTIATQTQQLAQCATCTQLTERLTAAHEEVDKVTDQITFLKEKSEILSKNLLIEQTNQKLLQQEKVELNEEKQSLMKDLTRLREHLIEMENAHTAEVLELQNMMELTKQEMSAMQEEARKSNTAYTSARYYLFRTFFKSNTEIQLNFRKFIYKPKYSCQSTH